jgi:hypothetical protein
VARRMVGIRLLRVGCPGGDIMQLMAAGKCFETVKNWIVGGNIEIRELMEENELVEANFCCQARRYCFGPKAEKGSFAKLKSTRCSDGIFPLTSQLLRSAYGVSASLLQLSDMRNLD